MGVFNKVNGLFSKKQKTNTEPLTTINDRFQFNINDLIMAKQNFDSFTKAVDQADKKLAESGLRTVTETAPFVTLYGMDLLLFFLANEVSEPITINFIEFDYPQNPGKLKAGQEPQKEIVESIDMKHDLTWTENGLVQIIADSWLNFDSADAGYESRETYINEILGYFDQQYGSLYEAIHGVVPSRSVEIPSEAEFMAIRNNGKIVSVKLTTGQVTPKDFHEAEKEKELLQVDQPTAEPNVDDLTHDYEAYNDLQQDLPIPAQDTLEAPIQHTQNQQSDLDVFLAKMNVLAFNFEGSVLPVEDLGDLPESDDQYPMAETYKLNARFNEERFALEDELNNLAQAELQRRISKYIPAYHSLVAHFEEQEEAGKVLNSESIEAELKEQSTHETKMQSEEIVRSEQEQIQIENERHQAALDAIKSEASEQRSAIEEQISKDLAPIRNQRLAKANATLEQKLAEDREKAIDDLALTAVATLTSFINDLMGRANQKYGQLIEKQNERATIEYDRIHKVHDTAVVTDTAKEAAHAKALEQVGLDNDQALLKQQYDNAIQRNQSLQAQLDSVTAELNGMKYDPRRMADELVRELSTKETNHLATNVSSEKKIETETKPKRKKPIGTMLATAAVLLTVAGTCGYSVMHANKQLESAKSTSVKMEKRLSELQKENKRSIKAAATAMSNSSSEDTPEPTTPTVDYTALDVDTAVGNLNVYRSQFLNKDLQTEARALAVGNLLIAIGDINGAKALSAANEGHNSLINQAIATALA